jgi:DNA-binding CsgD family transcriptional regulator
MPAYLPPSADELAEIYEAACDDTAWSRLGDRIAALAGVNTAGFWIAENSVITEMVLSEGHRETAPLYTAHYAAIDPWAAAVARLPRETPFLSVEHFAEDDLVRTEFYNDFAKRYGHFRPLGATMTIAPNVTASVSIENRFAISPFEAADKPRLTLLLPHIKRVIQLRRRFRAERQRGEIGAASLEMLSFGVVVCDAASRVVFCNGAAETMSTRLGTLTLTRETTLTGKLPAEEGRMLERLIVGAAQGGPGGVVRLHGQDGSGVIALVTQLPTPLMPERRAGLALVTLRAMDDAPSYARVVLSTAFGLTPSQAEIALLLFNGASADDIMRLRNIRMPTVRSHLAAIYARTNTDNQRDLIRLLGTLPPIRSGNVEK